MLRTICLAMTFALFFVAPAFADADYGHIHLTATDKTAAAEWYAKHFNGKTSGFGGKADAKPDRAVIDGIGILFFQKKAGFEGSVGSGVDHIGFSMSDVAGKVKEVEADGGKVLTTGMKFKGMEIAFVVDPWGTKIELIDDPDTRGLHHIHLNSPDVQGTLEWYANAFGGEITKFKGMLPAIKYDPLWLIVTKSNKPLAPTKGRAMDHLGWNFPDLDAAAVELKSKEVTFSMEPLPYKTIKIAFINGPDGVNIELVQTPKR